MNYRRTSFWAPAAIALCLSFSGIASVEASAISAGPEEPLAPVTLRFIASLAPDAMGQAAAQAKKKVPAPAIIPLPDGKGKDVTERTCSKCHATSVFAGQRHTAEKWSSIMDNMTSKGMEASDDDLNTVIDYLTANLAPPKTDAAPVVVPPPTPQ